MSDLVLMWIITVMLVALAIMRMLLAKRKGSPLSMAACLQLWLFPVAMVLAAVMFQTGIADILIPVLLLGVLEELLVYLARKRSEQFEAEEEDGGTNGFGS